MSKAKPTKKVVVTQKSTPSPTVSRTRRSDAAAPATRETLIFDNANYLWMGIGFALVVVGTLIMTGGRMPSPDMWDENIIYSSRITVLGPLIILAGLIVEIYAIFKK